MRILRGIANFWMGEGIRILTVFLWLVCGAIVIALFPLAVFVWPFWVSLILLIFNLAWIVPFLVWITDKAVAQGGSNR
jgi:hypothetical protein